jgi:predicted aldo/keto reductase-like oxidoreductase
MRYRKFGNSDWDISVLGFGTLRLPVQESNWRRINEELAIKIIHGAIDGGVNFFDTAYHYHYGMSENLLGKALNDGHRHKIKIATKMPTSIIRSKEDMDRILNKQLNRLMTDHIDFYLFQSLNRIHWEQLKQFEPIEWAERAIADGRIGAIGFSFHDKFDTFKDIIEYYNKWGLCYIQYNYLDVNNQAGKAGLELAYKNDVPVIVMEPLRGGQLTKAPTPKIDELWKSLGSSKSIVDLALQWIWDHKEVSSLMSGMNSLKDLEQNLKIADSGYLGCLSLQEKLTIEKVKEEIDKIAIIPCTSCNYCMPCPSKVFIPGILETYNELMIFSDKERARAEYNVWIPRELRANNCTRCGKCEKICPQGIEIIDWLQKAHKIFLEL